MTRPDKSQSASAIDHARSYTCPHQALSLQDEEQGDCADEARDQDDPAKPKIGFMAGFWDFPVEGPVDHRRRPEGRKSQRWADG